MSNPVIPMTISAEVRQADGSIEVETMAKRHLENLQDKKKQIRTKQEMLRDNLRNEKEYSEVEEELRKSQVKLKSVKFKLMAEKKELMQIAESINELKDEAHEEQLTLFGFLETYNKQTGSNIIELDNGEEFKFIRQFKIKKKQEGWKQK